MAGLYIHIPYCAQACHYCDFHFSTQFKTTDRMVGAMVKELQKEAANWADHTFKTIYFGGGTPSRLALSDLEILVQTIRQHFQLDLQEMTIEVNPEDVSVDSLSSWQAMGFDRLSMGVQSLDDNQLRTLNRVHGARQSKFAIDLAAQHDFKRISIDLIYGIPGTTNQQWNEQLLEISQWPIDHLSCYGLTIEPNTVLDNWIKKDRYPAPSDKAFQDQFAATMSFLEGLGWDHYEISNWSKPGANAVHNSAYWKGTPYLGIGPSAHSFDGQSRAWNPANNHQYMEQVETDKLIREQENLTKHERFNETMLTGLRTKWGVSRSEVEKHFGQELLSWLDQQMRPNLETQKAALENDRYILTPAGKFTADGIASDCFWVD